MFKQTTISKKIAAGIVAGLMIGSFSPVQAYSTKDAKRHGKAVWKACKPSAKIVSGIVTSLMGFEAIIETLIRNLNIIIRPQNNLILLNSLSTIRSFQTINTNLQLIFNFSSIIDASRKLRCNPMTFIFPIGIVLFISGLEGLKNQLCDKKTEQQNDSEQ